ncbi:MAG TPA: hypothetical protein VNN79_06160 [Actinomycetota bacterium]|nr:hypothetical protein [Actinomycetota bacterium]
MSRYFTSDGNEFVATSDQDLVEQMMKASFTPSADAAEFMRSVASRIKEEADVEIDTASTEAFVSALVDRGFLEEKDDDKQGDQS